MSEPSSFLYMFFRLSKTAIRASGVKAFAPSISALNSLRRNMQGNKSIIMANSAKTLATGLITPIKKVMVIVPKMTNIS